MKYTYEMVNAGLNKVIEYLNSIDNVWNETRNLKLYDVSFQAADIIDKYPLVKENRCDLFSDFCDTSYEQFTEWMQEEGLKDCRSYVGRTSSFYLTDMHCDTIGYVIDTLLTKIYGGYYQVDIDEAGMMIPFTDTEYFSESDQISDYQEGMEYIASGDFLKDVKNYFADAVKIAEYIDTFMEHQIENFTEYIECKNDDLEYQQEQEQQKEQAFIEKYGMAIGRLTADIEKVVIETGCTIAEASRMIHKAMEQVKPLEVVKEEIA